MNKKLLTSVVLLVVIVTGVAGSVYYMRNRKPAVKHVSQQELMSSVDPASRGRLEAAKKEANELSSLNLKTRAGFDRFVAINKSPL